MKSDIVYCDSCNKPVDILGSIKIFHSYYNENNDCKHEEYDFCEQCKDGILNLILQQRKQYNDRVKDLK